MRSPRTSLWDRRRYTAVMAGRRTTCSVCVCVCWLFSEELTNVILCPTLPRSRFASIFPLRLPPFPQSSAHYESTWSPSDPSIARREIVLYGIGVVGREIAIALGMRRHGST